jgi:hypothetical protein
MSTVIVPARVGPKVFADVPSAKELEDAKRAIENMRRGRTAATIWLILFAGALVAAGVFIFLLLTRPIEKPDAANDPALLRGKIAELEGSLTTSRSNFEDLQKRYETFAGLPETEEKFRDVSGKIRVFVDDKAKYGDIKARTIRAKPTPTRDQWAVYEKGRPVWKGEDAGQVKASIEQQVRDLEALLLQINATGPLSTTPGIGPNPCVGPNC